MRFLLCKFHCPSFICLCKSSPHINAPGSLKLENAPRVPSTAVLVADETSDELSGEVKNGTSDENPKHLQIDGAVCLRSSLKKKKVLQEVEEAKEEKKDEKKKKKKKKKKKVQWMDFSGKELVEIREFDSCEADELDPCSERNNLCIIL